MIYSDMAESAEFSDLVGLNQGAHVDCMWIECTQHIDLPFGKPLQKKYGRSPCFMGKLTIYKWH